jgi:DNA-directed RNA polymerase specialized sigma24 family protein
MPRLRPSVSAPDFHQTNPRFQVKHPATVHLSIHVVLKSYVFLKSEAGATEIERAYREEGGRLYYALLGYTGSADVASEAVSEAFARAMNDQRIRDLKPWVWRVAFRVASSEMKHRARHEALVDQVVPGPEPRALIDALAKLSDRQRASIVLHYYGGYSLDEIGQILGLRKGTVGVHLHRGRDRLRELLEVHDG